MFSLSPADEQIFVDAEFVFVYDFTLRADAETVWDGLTSDTPLDWCSPLSAHYESPRPHHVGTRRTAVVNSVIRLEEEFFLWDDAARRHAFFVRRSTLPTFSRFAELYEIAPTADGCTFAWTFAFEPRRGWSLPLRLTRPIVRTALLDALAEDTAKHFGGSFVRRPARVPS